ncbi:MAG: hypothetical protein IK038_03785 [Bacteroidaceae bacterium]|nr:hypothetical protein [Bacteroidaceae bacterium]
MNSGSFFRLDLEGSKVVNGITFYNYIDLPDFADNEDKVNYPIRLTISSEEVSFLVHYYSEDKPHHVEEVIINLPYNTRKVEGLSSIIKHLYNTPFPLNDYLYDLVKQRYTDQAPLNSAYYHMRQSQINRDSYSSLLIWGLIKKRENNEEFYIDLEDEQKKIVTKLLRKLLLDFMFDLMHSDIFESSKYYSQMRKGLLNDFFFSAIIKKSEYYYYRRLIRNRLKTFINPEDKTKKLFDVVKSIRKKYNKKRRKVWLNQIFMSKHPERIDKFNNDFEKEVKVIKSKESYSSTYNVIQSISNLYAEELDISETEWMETIMSPLADKHFSFTPEWFELLIPQRKKKLFSVSDSWFVDPEEEMSRIVFPLNDIDGKSHYLNSFELGSMIGIGDLSSVLKRNTKVSMWFYRRFDFVDTFRIHFFNHWNLFFATLLLAFSIASMFPCFWVCPKNIALFPATTAISCILYFLLSLFFGRNTNIIIDDVLLNNRRKRETHRALRLSLLFGVFWLFLYTYDCFTYKWSWLLIKGLILLFICILLLYIIKPRVHIINNIHLCLPRLVASITTAWIMIVIGNDLVKEHLSWPILAILSIVVFSFILYESNKVLPNITVLPRVGRTLELMLISFSISLIIGIFAVDILSPSLTHDAIEYNLWPNYFEWSFLVNNNNYAKEFTLTIFPDYLIQFSFLAMFIGVFIQMIFEEKNITEM